MQVTNFMEKNYLQFDLEKEVIGFQIISHQYIISIIKIHFKTILTIIPMRSQLLMSLHGLFQFLYYQSCLSQNLAKNIQISYDCTRVQFIPSFY